MENLGNSLIKDNKRLHYFRLPKIQEIIDRFHLNLSIRRRKKELKQFEVALSDITACFLNRYQYKYGLVRPSVISVISKEVLKRLMETKDSDFENLKQKVTARGLTYLIIYQSCITFLNSFHNSHPTGQSSYSETLLELMQFSLDGLSHEGLKNLFTKLYSCAGSESSFFS